jgi:C_GCAxxG_C_C family probable redox protein
MISEQRSLGQQAYDLAYNYEAGRGSCPQAVLSAIYEVLVVGDPKTIQAVDGLAGGVALSSEGTCGALSGGILVIGAVIGWAYQELSDGEWKRRVFPYAKKLYDRFHQEYQSVLCMSVQSFLFGRSYRLSDAEEYELFENAGAHDDKCLSVSGNVAKWTVEVLEPLIKKEKM